MEHHLLNQAAEQRLLMLWLQGSLPPQFGHAVGDVGECFSQGRTDGARRLLPFLYPLPLLLRLLQFL